MISGESDAEPSCSQSEEDKKRVISKEEDMVKNCEKAEYTQKLYYYIIKFKFF